MKWSYDGLEQCVDGAITEQLGGDSARPVPYLQLVSPVSPS